MEQALAAELPESSRSRRTARGQLTPNHGSGHIVRTAGSQEPPTRWNWVTSLASENGPSTATGRSTGKPAKCLIARVPIGVALGRG